MADIYYVVTGLACPKCHQPTVECRYWDSGAGYQFWDNFFHLCLSPSCQYNDYWEADGGVSPYEKESPQCPFCGREATSGERKERPRDSEGNLLDPRG